MTNTAYLRYLQPEITPDLLNVLAWHHSTDNELARNDIAELVFSLAYQNASRAITRQFLDAWKKLDIYQGEGYCLLRMMIRDADQMRLNNEKIRDLARNTVKKAPVDALLQFHNVFDAQTKLADEVSPYLTSPILRDILAPRETVDKKPRPKKTIQDVFASFEKQMNDDFSMIWEYGGIYEGYTDTTGKHP